MRKAEPIAGLGGLGLLVALFLKWYEAEPAVAADGMPQTLSVLVGAEPVDVTGWQAFAVVDVLLTLLALLALAVPLSTLLTKGPAKSIGTAVLASAFGWLAVLIVAWRIVFPPEDHHLAGPGAWIALAAAVLGWVGAWLSLRDESTPGAVAPEVPRRATPDAAA